MTDRDDLRAAMLAVLTEHYPNPVWCKCGWRASLSLNDTQSDRQQTLGHVADLLAEHPAPEPPRGDHPYVDPGNGRTECYLCGKFVHDVTHSCKGVPVTRAAEARVRGLIDAVRNTHEPSSGGEVTAGELAEAILDTYLASDYATRHRLTTGSIGDGHRLYATDYAAAILARYDVRKRP